MELALSPFTRELELAFWDEMAKCLLRSWEGKGDGSQIRSITPVPFLVREQLFKTKKPRRRASRGF
jgi:hypothetical protein